MADDLSLIVGELRGVTREIIARVDRSDNLTASKFSDLAAENTRYRDARETRDNAKDTSDEVRHNDLKASMDGTAVIARDAARWIETEGKMLKTRVDNIHDRVTAIEDGHKIAAAEERGSGKTWALIGGGISALVGIAGWLGWDSIKAMLERWHG